MLSQEEVEKKTTPLINSFFAEEIIPFYAKNAYLPGSDGNFLWKLKIYEKGNVMKMGPLKIKEILEELPGDYKTMTTQRMRTQIIPASEHMKVVVILIEIEDGPYSHQLTIANVIN